MKKLLQVAAALSLFSTINSQLSTVRAQGTAFTYQGRLNDGVNPANGAYDLRFVIYDNSAGGSQQGPILTNSATAASNGLFTVTLDFGNQFPGANRWLEIAVRTNGGGGFFTLSPRQPLTPAPYAITAGNVVSGGITGTYGNAVSFNNANNNFSGAFSGNGANVTNVNATLLDGLDSTAFWKLGGNAGTLPGTHFLGTSDSQSLQFKVNNLRALWILPGGDSLLDSDTNDDLAPNLIGGSFANTVGLGVVGATIAGGGAGNLNGISVPNQVGGDYATVGGGVGNLASNLVSTVAGGQDNRASGIYSTISGGRNNTIPTPAGAYATIGGGFFNTASGSDATVGGGGDNTASGGHATVPGGDSCTAAGFWSFAAGKKAKANHDGTFVWADSNFSDFASTGNDQFLIRASGGVGIGLTNPASQLHVSAAGGNPQLQITQTTTTDYTRLRMNVLGSPSWEMDVSPGATPALSWWTGSIKMNLDFNGNLTTSGTVNGTSDRNAKEKFTAVSSRAVLDKVAALPISEWNFKNESAVRHIGPMAQDFYAAFSVGMDDKHIATVDEGGVALAAIQGLNQKLEQKGAEITELKQRLAALEKIILNQKPN